MTSTSKRVLTEVQRKACNQAIKTFLTKATIANGKGSVILLPEFEEGADGTWSPVAGTTGVRPTSTNSAFMRFGMMTINAKSGVLQPLYTNVFGDSEDDIAMRLLFIDPNAKVGGSVHGVRIVIHEQLRAFGRKNPDADIKWADKAANIPCVKYVPDNEGVVTEQPIYRRTLAFFEDVYGMYHPDAVNKLISHDNGDVISNHAYAQFNRNNNPAAGIKATA